MVGANLEIAVEKTTDILNENENVVAAVGFDELDIIAWESAKENCGADIVLIGLGFYDSAMQLMEEEKIDALYINPVYEYGQLSASYLHELINGNVFEEKEEWFVPVDFHVTYPGGEGENDIATYRDIFNAAQEYFAR